MADNETDLPLAKPGDAGRDRDIAERMDKDSKDEDAKLDHALDESMDASDPPAMTGPGEATAPAPSSGYDAEQEHKRAG